MSDLALSGGLAIGGPARVGEVGGGVALRGGGGCGVDAGALRLLLLQQLLGLAVVQRGAAGLQRDGVGAHAGVEPAAAAHLQLLQVLPVELLARQQAHALHDADLFLGVVVVADALWERMEGWHRGEEEVTVSKVAPGFKTAAKGGTLANTQHSSKIKKYTDTAFPTAMLGRQSSL